MVVVGGVWWWEWWWILVEDVLRGFERVEVGLLDRVDGGLEEVWWICGEVCWWWWW